MRLLLVSLDELRELWDALLAHRSRFDDPADDGLAVTRGLCDRVGELMATEYGLACGIGPLRPAERTGAGHATADLIASIEATEDYWPRRWAIRRALVLAFERGRCA